jgi:hypothetical protein
MLFSRKEMEKYTRLPAIDDSVSSDLETEREIEIGHTGGLGRLSTRKVALRGLTYVVSFILFALVVGSIASLPFWRPISVCKTSTESTSRCQNPKVRKEWRTLSTRQKEDYIDAVRCLQHFPSRLHAGLSLYDDFPFLHDVVGDYGTRRQI